MDQRSAYDDEFFADQVDGSLSSARVVLPLVFDIHRPSSVLDIGCGVGTWLHVARELGADRVCGIDGHDLGDDELLIDRAEFVRRDLNRSLHDHDDMNLGRFDLALCLEVAEHLPGDVADDLVRVLCAHADVVVFSAAIAGQLGTDHITTEPPSRWALRFAHHGYDAVDVIRPQVWADDRADYWYRQNVILYVNRARPEVLAAAEERRRAVPAPLDIVHPDLLAFYVRRAGRPVSTRQAAGALIGALQRAARRRLPSRRP